MGIDAKAHIHPEFSADDVAKFLKATDGVTNVVVGSGSDTTYITISFEYGEEKRMISFFYRLGMFNSNLISIGKWGNGVNLLKEIVQAFSGIYIPDDLTHDNVELFYHNNRGGDAAYSETDALFVHKWGIVNRKITGSGIDDMNIAEAAFNKYVQR